MSLVSDILGDIDEIRGDVPGDIGLRPFRIWVTSRAWSGTRVGVGTKTDTTTELTCAGRPPKVKQISDADVIASGGLYSSGDIEVGPITPAYTGGGVAVSTWQPNIGASPTEGPWFRVTGPGYPTAGAWFKSKSSGGNFSTRVTLVMSQTGESP